MFLQASLFPCLLICSVFLAPQPKPSLRQAALLIWGTNFGVSTARSAALTPKSISRLGNARQALPSQAELRKITFDVFRSAPGGATGQSDSWRSLSYEFCIPAREGQLAEVQSIDPLIRHFSHSRGRIGCRSGQYLCIADAHSPQWREILYAIARLEYVERIDEFFGE